MHTNLFNPFRIYLREEAPADLTPPGEQNPAQTPEPALAEQPSAPENSDNDAPSFNLDAIPEPSPQPDDKNPDDKSPNENQEQNYTVELPENFQASDDFKTLITQQAKAAGLDGKTAGQYVSGVITAMQAAEAEALTQSTKTLKEEWGTNFNANMQQVKTFTAKLRAKTGLTAEDLAPLQSPKGFKLLHTLMTATNEDTFIGNKNATPGRSNTQEAHSMLTDPQHPDYAALDDPQHPRHAEANRKYNRLVGLS